jgi:hypothetical protein
MYRVLRGYRGISPANMDAILGALSLKIALVHDEQQFAKMRLRLPRRGGRGLHINEDLPLAHRERDRTNGVTWRW